MTTTTATASGCESAQAGLSTLILTIGAFALLTTEFIILGVLPGLAHDLGLTIPEAGQLVTLFAFAVMVAGPFVTAAIAHLDRKRTFMCILLIFAMSNALAAMATGFWTLAAARILAAVVLPAYWGMASETAGQLAGVGREGKAVARIYMGITAGFVFGIPAGTLAATLIGWRGTFWMLAALCLAIILMMMFCLPRLPSATRAASGASQVTILTKPRFLVHVLLSVIVFTSMFTAYTYLSDTLERLANIPNSQVGWWLMGFGAVGMVGNAIGGRLVDKGPVRATILLLVILAIGMAATTFVLQTLWFLIAALAVWGLAYTALFPVCQVRVMRAGSSAKALAGTMNVSAANGGIGIGAALGGASIEHFGLWSIGWVASGIAILAAIIALLLKDSD